MRGVLGVTGLKTECLCISWPPNSQQAIDGPLRGANRWSVSSLRTKTKATPSFGQGRQQQLIHSSYIIDSDAPSYTTPTPNFLDQVSHASCCLILTITASSHVFDPNPPLALSRRVSFVIDTDAHTQSYHTTSYIIIASQFRPLPITRSFC